MIRNLLFIAVGGAIGSLFRYLISVWTVQLIGQNWLFSGTAAVNIIGCFFIGVTVSFLQEKELMDNSLTLFLIVGLLGGFTTFSSFGLEGFDAATVSLQKGLIYATFQVIMGLVAVWAGLAMSKWLL